MANYKFGVNEPPHKRWPVAWYNPAVLARSAREMVASGDFIRNFDRRELFTADFKVIDQSHQLEDGDFWWDFMSDSGDGGNASYTVARAMQSPNLAVTLADGITSNIGTNFPASKLLILGGDLAYPGASGDEYQYRFIEMWEAAKPTVERSPLTVVSIPQNHDWFDNISSFARHFVGEYDNHFLQAHTPQNRSYFATRLPQGWWVLGLDFALIGDLDRGQFEAFLDLLKPKSQTNPLPIEVGDNVILVYPEPYWTRPLGDGAGVGYPRRYQRLEAALIAHGVKIRIRLAGDLHHYKRETATEGAHLNYEDMLITCGIGGAFLHPTHAKRVVKTKVMDCLSDSNAMTPDLEKRVCVGLKTTTGLSENQREYSCKVSYPSEATSKFLSLWNLIALFKPASITGLFADQVNGTRMQRLNQRLGEIWDGVTAGNIMFPLLLGLLYLLAVYCNSFVFSKAFINDGFVPASQIGNTSLFGFIELWFKALFFSPLALGIHIILLGLCGSVAHEDGWHSGVIGALYGIIHILAAATLFWLGCFYHLDPYIKGVVIFVGGVIVGGFLYGIYFTLVTYFGGLANNGFSPLGYEGYKGFLRFRIDSEGNLHGYMIGTDDVPKRWITNPNAERPLWVERADQAAPDWKLRDQFTLEK